MGESIYYHGEPCIACKNPNEKHVNAFNYCWPCWDALMKEASDNDRTITEVGFWNGKEWVCS